ncbi:MAG: hypothetical protein [Circular genetic element sp.]|nr:MAG: hypothetical protein [Circular genetic element sp.]
MNREFFDQGLAPVKKIQSVDCLQTFSLFRSSLDSLFFLRALTSVTSFRHNRFPTRNHDSNVEVKIAGASNYGFFNIDLNKTRHNSQIQSRVRAPLKSNWTCLCSWFPRQTEWNVFPSDGCFIGITRIRYCIIQNEVCGCSTRLKNGIETFRIKICSSSLVSWSNTLVMNSEY